MNEEYEDRERIETAVTEQLIYGMLTENTGKALCDSGDIYGRHWEKNQHKTLWDFKNEPSVTYTISKPESKNDNTIKLEDIDYKISVFHYLKSIRFSQDTICQYFNTHFVPTKEHDSDKAFGLSEAGEKWLENWGFEFKEVFNTTNEKDFLSQALQGTYLDLCISTHNYFGLYSRRYVLLQVHQGCDVRGGYTDARLFYLPSGGLPKQHVYGSIRGYEINNYGDGDRLHILCDKDEYKEEIGFDLGVITRDEPINLSFAF